MPKRSDGWFINDKEELRFCVRHACYYRETFGCQQCYLEDEKKQVNEENRQKITNPEKTPVALFECNVCGHNSLWFNSKLLVYECLNFTCEQVISADDLKKANHVKPLKVDYSQVDSRGEINYKADVSPPYTEISRSYCEEHHHYFEVGVGCQDCIDLMLGKPNRSKETNNKQTAWDKLFGKR